METTRSVRPFEVISEYEPSGDQPQAIAELAKRINACLLYTSRCV